MAPPRDRPPAHAWQGNGPILNLSHICHGEESSQSESESRSESESSSPGGSVKERAGTPAGSQPNTAIGQSGTSPLPTVAFSLILLASLGALAYANVKSVRS